ncbi:MAG: hypothetical protein AAGD11_20025 [Planctomycetota bacterium]
MSEQENRPEPLVSVTTDLEAAMIVSALAAQNVDATTTGSFTAGFRAEAPGEVQVLVRKRDLPKAIELLEELRGTPDAARTNPDSGQVAGSGRFLAVSVLVLVLALVLTRLI